MQNNKGVTPAAPLLRAMQSETFDFKQNFSLFLETERQLLCGFALVLTLNYSSNFC